MTACGLLAASSVKTRVPEAEPMAVGVKVTPTVHLAPAAMLAPHVLEEMAKGALAEMPPKLRATFWLLVRVTVLDLLVLPTTVLLKLRLVAESVTGALPVPVRETVCGLSRASSVKVRVPVVAPSAVGENSTPTVQLAPAAMLAPQVLVATRNGPLAEMPEKLSVTLCRLVRVTVLAALVSPTAIEPRLRLLEESETGALPLPVRETDCVPALSEIVTEPETEPRADGENVTDTVQVLPGAMVPMQVPVWLKGAVARTAVTVSGPVPVLVKVMVLALLVEPMTWDWKDRLAGVTEAAGAVPVPVRARVCMGPRLKESSLAVSVPVYGPAADGAKVTLAVQLVPATSVPAQLSDSVKLPAAMREVKSSGLPPKLVMVTGWVELVPMF